MKIYKVLLLFPFFLIPYSSFAAATSSTLQKVGFGTTVVYVRAMSNLINPAGCESSTYSLTKEHLNFEHLFSMLLAAKLSNSKVRLAISDTKCNGKYPQITFVEIL